MNKDTLQLVALKLELPDLLNFCGANKRMGEICNEDFWRRKLDLDFPRLWKVLTHKGKSYKDLYLFLKKILTKKRFEQMIFKPGDDAYDSIGIGIDPSLDLYDLLYNNDSDHSWGFIKYKGKDWFEEWLYNNEIRIMREETPIPLNETIRLKLNFGDLHFMLDEVDAFGLPYRDAEIGRIRHFLDDEISQIAPEIYEDVEQVNVSSSKVYTSYEDFIQNLKTFEDRFQNYINRNTQQDVRQEIADDQKSLFKNVRREGEKFENFPQVYYNKEEIEFLQILHDAIKANILKVFDPLKYDFIMNKLTR